MGKQAAESSGNEAFGPALGAAARGGDAANYAGAAWQALAGGLGGGASAAGFLRAKAAIVENFRAQEQACRTSTQFEFLPQWAVNQPEVVLVQARPLAEIRSAPEKDESGYRPLQLESHQEFSAKLAKR